MDALALGHADALALNEWLPLGVAQGDGVPLVHEVAVG